MVDPTAGTTRPSTRGVTTVLRYALFLAIVTILVTGLFVGVGELVETQQERAIGSQLETVGNDLATDLGTTSRLADAGGSGTNVTVRSQLPDAVAGSEYLVRIRGSPPRYEITLRSVDPEIRTTVVVRSDVPIENTTVSGGRLNLIYNGTNGRVEVHHG